MSQNHYLGPPGCLLCSSVQRMNQSDFLLLEADSRKVRDEVRELVLEVLELVGNCLPSVDRCSLPVCAASR